MNALPEPSPMFSPAPPAVPLPGRRLAPWPALVPAEPVRRPAAREAFLEVAAAIGGKLCRDAIWSGDRCTWMGRWVTAVDGQTVDTHEIVGPDLYLGSAGVGAFLARLAAATGEPIVARTARAALRRSLAVAESIPAASRLGLYSGWPGLALAGLDVAETLGDEALRSAALDLFDRVAADRGDEAGGEWDLLAGLSGAIPALLRGHRRYGGPETLVERAIELGDDLVARGARGPQGLSWGEWPGGVRPPGASGSFGNLAGFSHGASGAGWALFELWAASGEARFRAAAEEAFRYERHWLDLERGNWPDLRDPRLSAGRPDAVAAEPSFMRAWCHGAPGIALARLRAFELTGDARHREEAEIAVATTRRALLPGSDMCQTNYSLCHGRGGNAEVLLHTARVLGRHDEHDAAEEVAWQGRDEFHAMKLPWPCGSRGQVEVPSLLIGLAGIGHFYLRMAAPQTPSWLLVTPTDGEP